REFERHNILGTQGQSHRVTKPGEVRFLSPVHVVPKKGGKWRKILESRELNKQFQMESMPLGQAIVAMIFTNTLKYEILAVRKRLKQRILANADDLLLLNLDLLMLKQKNNGYQGLHNESGMDNSGKHELNGTKSGVRISGLALENRGDALSVNDRQQEKHAQGTQTIDEQSKEQRKYPRRKTNKFNWRNLIYRQSMETIAFANKVAGSIQEQEGQLERIEQPRTSNIVTAQRSELVVQQDEQQFRGMLPKTTESNVEDSITREVNSMRQTENSQTQVFQSKGATSFPLYNSQIFDNLAQQTF
ncbi:MAG: hypothetical protein EZS28_011951, partial [Streblomastix strix]